jgi:hypothetical protein
LCPSKRATDLIRKPSTRKNNSADSLLSEVNWEWTRTWRDTRFWILNHICTHESISESCNMTFSRVGSQIGDSGSLSIFGSIPPSKWRTLWPLRQGISWKSDYSSVWNLGRESNCEALKSDTDRVACISRDKMDKQRRYETEKPKLSRVKQISILARRITERKPDIRGSGENDNSAQRKIHKTDRGFPNTTKFQMRGRSRGYANNHKRAKACDENTRRERRAKDDYVENPKISGETTARPAIPLDIILPRLELLCFSGQVCKFFEGDPNCRRLECRCQQIAFVKDIAESRDNIPVSINALMRAFDCPPSRVQAALAHGVDDPGQWGKHIAIDQDCEQHILDWIRQNAGKETPITR